MNESHIHKELALKRAREMLSNHTTAAVVAVLSSWSVKMPKRICSHQIEEAVGSYLIPECLGGVFCEAAVIPDDLEAVHRGREPDVAPFCAEAASTCNGGVDRPCQTQLEAITPAIAVAAVMRVSFGHG